MGGGDLPGPPQDDDEDGRVALPDRGGRPEGADDLRAGLQPDPAGDAGIGPSSRGRGAADQLRGRDAMAGQSDRGEGAGGPGGQSLASRPSGASSEEASPETVPVHDQA